MHITAALQRVAAPSSREVADPAQLDNLRRDARVVRPPTAAELRSGPSDDVACRGRRGALVFLGASTLQLAGRQQVVYYPRLPRAAWCLSSFARHA